MFFPLGSSLQVLYSRFHFTSTLFFTTEEPEGTRDALWGLIDLNWQAYLTSLWWVLRIGAVGTRTNDVRSNFALPDWQLNTRTNSLLWSRRPLFKVMAFRDANKHNRIHQFIRTPRTQQIRRTSVLNSEVVGIKVLNSTQLFGHLMTQDYFL